MIYVKKKNKKNKKQNQQLIPIDDIIAIEKLLQITIGFIDLHEQLKQLIPFLDQCNNRETGQAIRHLNRLYLDHGIEKLFAITQQFDADCLAIPLSTLFTDQNIPIDNLPNAVLNIPLSELFPGNDTID